MNKSEREAFDSLQEKLRIAKAFRFTERTKRDIPIPSSGQPMAKGFDFNSHRQHDRVVRACSTSVNHGFGRDDRTDTQRPTALFSTELLAWRAMRNEMEDRFSAELAKVDAEIEKLIGGSQ